VVDDFVKIEIGVWEDATVWLESDDSAVVLSGTNLFNGGLLFALAVFLDINVAISVDFSSTIYRKSVHH
jgi:hypothetical protein